MLLFIYQSVRMSYPSLSHQTISPMFITSTIHNYYVYYLSLCNSYTPVYFLMAAALSFEVQHVLLEMMSPLVSTYMCYLDPSHLSKRMHRHAGDPISLFEIWRAQKERGCFNLGNLLSAQFITQTEARPLLLCPPYFKKAYAD